MLKLYVFYRLNASPLFPLQMKWTETEKTALLEIVERNKQRSNGRVNWIKVSEELGSRTPN